jgi:hypothetical protein
VRELLALEQIVPVCKLDGHAVILAAVSSRLVEPCPGTWSRDRGARIMATGVPCARKAENTPAEPDPGHAGEGS